MRLSFALLTVVGTFASTSAFNVNKARISQKLTDQKAISIPLDQDIEKVAIPVQAERDAWVRNLDYDAFAKEVNALGKQLVKDTNEDDVAHLNKILKWRDACGAVGVLTMFLPPNPVTIVALSTWVYASWTMVAHRKFSFCFCIRKDAVF